MKKLKSQYNDLVNSNEDAIEEILGDSSSGLVKKVNDLDDELNNENTGLSSKVSDLQEVVGNSNSGLVKDVDDLQTAVSGLSSKYLYQIVIKCGTMFNQNNAKGLRGGDTSPVAYCVIYYHFPTQSLSNTLPNGTYYCNGFFNEDVIQGDPIWSLIKVTKTSNDFTFYYSNLDGTQINSITLSNAIVSDELILME